MNVSEDYLQDGTSPYFGALVGRVANRIAKGSFSLEGQQYNLSINDPPNTLHGGVWGFSRRSWKMTWSGVNDDGHQAVKLALISDDGEEARLSTMEITQNCCVWSLLCRRL